MGNIEDMQDHQIPQGFTLGLAIVDAIPVVEFCISMLVIALRFQSILFMIGAFCSILAGCGKVLWKILLAMKQKNIVWLNKQFRYLMSIGFLLMIVAVIVHLNTLHLGAVLLRALQLPAVVFFVLGICGMVVMGILGAKLDPTVAKNNWKEQITNLVAQAMLLIGILLW